MGRKNKRKRSEYRDRLGFNPWRYVDHNAASYKPHGSSVSVRSVSAGPDEARQPKRGDIWFADLGSHPGTSVQDGCRPVFILSNDIGNRHAETINVLPMTKHLKRQGLPCHTKLDPEKIRDLKQSLDTSMILAEQVTTISKSALRNYVGYVSDDALMDQVDRAVSMQLGISDITADTNDEDGRDGSDGDHSKKGARV